MEDVKEPNPADEQTVTVMSFNPCFNGRCKRTNPKYWDFEDDEDVSILVLMEDVKELS